MGSDEKQTTKVEGRREFLVAAAAIPAVALLVSANAKKAYAQYGGGGPVDVTPGSVVP